MNLSEFVQSSKEILLTLLLALFALAAESFLLFHIAAEGITIVIGIIIFVKSCQTLKNSVNSFMVFLGTAFMFVAFYDFIHLLTYHGMDFPVRDSADKSTQLWLAGRYVLSVSFLLAPFFMVRKFPAYWFHLVNTVAAAAILSAVFFSRLVPVCLVLDKGLTKFKIYNEYIICVIFLLAILHFLKKRVMMDRDAFTGITAALSVFIVSEICFTLYIGVYAVVNILGHILKVLAYGFIYYGIVFNDPGIMHPRTEDGGVWKTLP